MTDAAGEHAHEHHATWEEHYAPVRKGPPRTGREAPGWDLPPRLRVGPAADV